MSEVDSGAEPPPISPLRQLARAAASLGILNILAMGITFLVGVLLARNLGPTGYGVYTLAMVVTTFAGMLTEFGLPVLTMREFAAARAHGLWSDAKGLLYWSDRVVLAISAVVLVGVLLSGNLVKAADRSVFLTTLMWAVLLIPVVALTKLRGLALLSLGRTMAGQLPVLVLRPGLFAAAMGLCWYLLHLKPTPTGAMFLQVAAAGIALLFASVNFLRLRPAPYRAAARTFPWKGWLAASFPLGATEGLRLLQGQVAVLILGAFSSASAAGLYRVADATMSVCLVVTSVLATSASPMFAGLFAQHKKAELSNVLVVTSLVMTIAIVCFGLPIAIAGGWIFKTVFGERFHDAAAVFTILWLGNLGAATMGALVSYANMTGSERTVTVGTFIALVTNATVSISLVPFLHERGAAIGTVAGFMSWNFYILWRMKRRDGFRMTAFGVSRIHLQQARDSAQKMLATLRPA